MNLSFRGSLSVTGLSRKSIGTAPARCLTTDEQNAQAAPSPGPWTHVQNGNGLSGAGLLSGTAVRAPFMTMAIML
jgi:hypothetical protein